MNPTQCKMARAALGLSLSKLSELSGVSGNTINRFENGKDSYSSTAAKLKTTFEENGIVFIAQNGGGPGVRLRGPVK